MFKYTRDAVLMIVRFVGQKAGDYRGGELEAASTLILESEATARQEGYEVITYDNIRAAAIKLGYHGG